MSWVPIYSNFAISAVGSSKSLNSNTQLVHKIYV